MNTKIILLLWKCLRLFMGIPEDFGDVFSNGRKQRKLDKWL